MSEGGEGVLQRRLLLDLLYLDGSVAQRGGQASPALPVFPRFAHFILLFSGVFRNGSTKRRIQLSCSPLARTK